MLGYVRITHVNNSAKQRPTHPRERKVINEPSHKRHIISENGKHGQPRELQRTALQTP